MDKLRALAFFCRTVETRSFAAAGQALDVVPSAVSKTIAALERELGFKLLSRSTRGLALTEEGAAYYDHCRTILQELDEAEALARRGRATPMGTLRIGMHPGLRALLLGALGAFLDRHRGLNVETTMTNSAPAVIDQGLDMVVRIGPLADSSLIARQIAWTTAIACASPAYLARWGIPLAPRDLERHSAIVYGRRDEESNTRWEFVHGDEREIVHVPVRLTVRDGIGLNDAVLGGCGIARPFEVSARSLLAAGRVQRVLPDWSSERYAVHVVLPPHSRTAPAKVRAFTDFLQQLMAAPDS